MHRVHLVRMLATALVVTSSGACSSGGDSSSSGPVNISGKITFDRVPHAEAASAALDYKAIAPAPARGIQVEAVSAGGGILATGDTDEVGNYSLSVPGRINLFIRAKARMYRQGAWDFSVVDNTSDGALYVLDGSPASSGTDDSVRDLHAPSGWGGSGYTAPRSAAPFAILDSVRRALEKVRTVAPDTLFPPLMLNWSPNNLPAFGDPARGEIVTTHYNGNAIYILGKANVDTDEYDRHIIVHEWAHYFEHHFSRVDSLGGSHGIGDRLDLRVAFSEGWSNAFSAMALDDPLYKDSSWLGQAESGVLLDLEQNSNPNPGWYSEGSTQSLLYDLYDESDDGPDRIALGFGPIHAVLTGPHESTPALISLFTFATYLKELLDESDQANLDTLLAIQRVAGNTIWGAGETNDGGFTAALPIYKELSPNGTAVDVCTSSRLGRYNKLGNRQFLRLRIPMAGSYTIAARQTSGSGDGDPDLYLRNAGLVALSEGYGTSETILARLEPGEYVLELYEFNWLSDACFDVNLSQP